MKKSGAWLLTYALEQVGVTHTFGIPGVHVTEIYDALAESQHITPVLVTHEGGAAFMADGMSRTSPRVGTLVVVPAAGVTHAMSGIGEAFLDGIPMLVIAGGVRRDSGKAFQLHQWDQQAVMRGITKASFLIQSHQEIIPTLFQAFEIAISGEPGPVFVEIPAEIQMFRGEVENPLPVFKDPKKQTELDEEALNRAVELLSRAKWPGLFVGWGAVDASAELVVLAETLGAPVATTLQGLSTFPASHPLHTGMGFGPAAVPAAEKAFANCDLLLAVGTRFGEIATGSYGIKVPEQLIHVDINPEVFDRNYSTTVTLQGDARIVLKALLERIEKKAGVEVQNSAMSKLIAREKAAYAQAWRQHDSGDRVHAARFFSALRATLDEDAFVVVDDGNHTFLAAELFPVLRARRFISPTDFNCMGYAVPASLGVKLANPDAQVAVIAGDGAFLMTCMELLTAASYGLNVMVFVMHDGELSQISQSQKIPYNRKTCTQLANFDAQGIARATGTAFVDLDRNERIDSAINEALRISGEGRPVIVDVRIDYSKKTRFTQGIVKTNLGRFSLSEKLRFVGRALFRRLPGKKNT